MIKIDFFLGIALYLGLFIFNIFILWLWQNKKSLKLKDFSLDPRFLWQCSVCLYVYINTKDDAFSMCPRCGCYNSKA